jgi:hypothetical protein
MVGVELLGKRASWGRKERKGLQLPYLVGACRPRPDWVPWALGCGLWVKSWKGPKENRRGEEIMIRYLPGEGTDVLKGPLSPTIAHCSAVG